MLRSSSRRSLWGKWHFQRLFFGTLFLVGSARSGTNAQALSDRQREVFGTQGEHPLLVSPGFEGTGFGHHPLGETPVAGFQMNFKQGVREKNLLETLENAMVVRLFEGAALHLAQVQITFLLARKEQSRDHF